MVLVGFFNAATGATNGTGVFPGFYTKKVAERHHLALLPNIPCMYYEQKGRRHVRALCLMRARLIAIFFVPVDIDRVKNSGCLPISP